QNTYFDLLHSSYPAKKKLSDKGDREAGKWIEEFIRLGDGLFINVDNVVANMATAQKKDTLLLPSQEEKINTDSPPPLAAAAQAK
ncbi:MAG: hypothetical protein MUO63_11895, partial [Desulfobulbaceae bacterium]|nr:hypothetical protein [Desulfobulbaceae bacterium]